ncbi:unnamed protein product [Gadus morhua 'NCC']
MRSVTYGRPDAENTQRQTVSLDDSDDCFLNLGRIQSWTLLNVGEIKSDQYPLLAQLKTPGVDQKTAMPSEPVALSAGATSESLVCGRPGSLPTCQPHTTPDTISIKVEEDIGGGLPAVEVIRDCQSRSAAPPSESLRVDAPGSSHCRSQRELRILKRLRTGEGPLAVDGHDTLCAVSELEALSSLSADHSVAKA